MARKKAPKKSEEVAESSSPDGDIVFDTIPHAIDTIKSWRQIFETLDYEIKNFLHVANNELRYIAESKLHKVAIWLRLMTSNDMISWVLERTDVQMRSILDN
jgi:hypothetical protein